MTGTRRTPKTAEQKAADKAAKAKAAKAAKANPLQAAEQAATKKAEAKAAATKEAADKVAVAKEAARVAAKATADLAKEAEKEKKEAEKAKALEATTKALTKTAQSINGRIDRLNTADKKLDDHRLALSIELAVAKEQCKEGGIAFQKWCDVNIKQGYETTRKLLPIGEAERNKEGDGVLMLEDLRSGAAQRQAELRAKKASEDKEAANLAAGIDPNVADPVKVREAIDKLSEEDWVSTMQAQADSGGYSFVKAKDGPGMGDDSDGAEADVDVDVDSTELSAVESITDAFYKLSASEQIEFGELVAEALGMKLVEAD